MCAQVMCEVPEDCTAGANFCGDAGANCQTYCPTSCDPCQVPEAFPPCPPSGDCNRRCECGDYSSCCYQQPTRTLPIRPMTSIMRDSAPLDTDTIYKRSYFANCGDCFRAKPVLPCNHIHSSKAPMENCTVQKLSYPPPCIAGRTAAIRPIENGLRFNGPLYAMTSQKHDFVPKDYSKRPPIKPPNGIWRPCDPMERCTVNKLSFMPVDICQHPPPKPIVQTYHYLRPTAPGERCTVQKLSYLPVCLPAKEPMPWAQQVRCQPPNYENLCTTYKLSYMPNCNTGRTPPVMPMTGLKFFGTDCNDGNTVYKLSYVPVDSRCCRPQPILPMGGIHMPKGEFEKCTVQKLSYQPNCCVGRTQAIRPKENCVKPTGPLYSMTTQKHDYVAKPQCRRPPIKPPSLICRASGNIEKCTVNKLSYMPVNVCEYPRPNAILPRPGIYRSDAPIEKCTTHKLSYMPNCIPRKEILPWAGFSSYEKPTAPIEKCTIQKLSYGPPGTFSRCGGGCGANQSPQYPAAGVSQQTNKFKQPHPYCSDRC